MSYIYMNMLFSSRTSIAVQKINASERVTENYPVQNMKYLVKNMF